MGVQMKRYPELFRQLAFLQNDPSILIRAAKYVLGLPEQSTFLRESLSELAISALRKVPGR